MHVCVTGGLGVIGSWVTRLLVERGIRPVVLSRNPDFSLLPDCVGRFDFVACDIQDAERVDGIFRSQKFDGVVHGAALTMALSEASPIDAIKVNDVGTAIVMNAVGASGARRVVFVSSGSIYDVWRDEQETTQVVLREDYPIRPVHISRITKVAAEEIGRYFARRYGFRFAAIRSSTMYGPGKLRHHGSQAIHALLVENAIEGRPTRIDHGGDQLDDIIYAADIAQAIVSALVRPQLRYDVYNIASGQSITLRTFADAVKTVFPNAAIAIGAGKNYLGSGLVKDRAFDVSRARTDLEFVQKYDLVSAIRSYRDLHGLMKTSAASNRA
ncbi:MAG: NAD(P)-dependent oxidoreductase [Burkholderiales bacterium]|nr:NAD(P)-dependent oxidoreductase [Burkholderiales bacterium]